MAFGNGEIYALWRNWSFLILSVSPPLSIFFIPEILLHQSHLKRCANLSPPPNTPAYHDKIYFTPLEPTALVLRHLLAGNHTLHACGYRRRYLSGMGSSKYIHSRTPEAKIWLTAAGVMLDGWIYVDNAYVTLVDTIASGDARRCMLSPSTAYFALLTSCS